MQPPEHPRRPGTPAEAPSHELEPCRTHLSTKVHWFCTHLAPEYGKDHRKAVQLMQRANIFEWQDVTP